MAATTGFRVQCPSCEAMVSIKTNALVGKKVDCPKCKYRFLVEAPADLDEEEAGGKATKAGQGGGTAVAKKAPAKTKSRNEHADSAPQKKKSNTILFVGIGIVVLTLGVLAAAFFGGLFDGDDPKPAPSGGPAAKSGTTTGTGGNPGASNGNSVTAAGPGTPATPGLVRDATNLLMNDTQWVLDVAVPEVLKTPAGSTLFHGDKPTRGLVKDYLGVSVDEIERVVGSGGGDGAWSFTVIKTRSSVKDETLRAAMDLGDPAGNIKNRDYYVVKENPLFEAVGNYFATKLKEFSFVLEPPPGPREMSVCQVDSTTLVVADRYVMEKFLDLDCQPDYRSKLTTAQPAAPATGGPGMPGMPMMPGMPGGSGPGGPVTPGEAKSDRFGGQPPVAPSLPPPGKGPGMPGMPGMPGSGGPAAPAAPKVFTAYPTFRTINPQLKAMLNHMEGETKPVFNFAARVETNRLMDVFFGGGINFGGGKFMPSLPPGAKGRDAVPKAPFVGITLYAFDSSKFDLKFGIDCDDEEQAKDVESLLRLFLPIIAAAVAEEAGIPVRAGGANNQNPGFPGFPGGPGSPSFPGGPSPGTPGAPGMPMPGGPSRPGAPGGPGGAKSDFAKDPFAGQPPGVGGKLGGPPMPGGPGMPIMPGGPGSPGFPGMPGMPGPGGPGTPGGTGGTGGRSPSSVDVLRTDKIVSIAINLDWKDDFANKVRPSLTDYFDGVAGQGMLLAAKHPWHKLPPAVKRLAASGKFPRAAASRPSTAARMGLPFAPEQRVSWMVELLPGLGYGTLYSQIDKGLGWNTPGNLRAARAWIPEFLDPSQESDSWRANLNSVVGRDLGGSHFVGLSGIGQDAADLPDSPEHAKRLGVFGYERETAVPAITDGLDKTIFMIQTQPNIARPWIRGGGATVQGVAPTSSFLPYRVMQDNKDFGAYAIMCDGSVRFIKPSIPDELFVAMVTYKAGDSTVGIDEHAPKVELTSRLRTPAAMPKLPDTPPAYVPKDWQPIGMRVSGALFGLAMPQGRIDAIVEQTWERSFTGQWAGKNLTLGAAARHKFGLPATDPTGAAAQAEIEKFLEVSSLHQDGNITDAPNLGPSKGKEFRAKANKDSKGTAIYRLWVVNGARFVMSVESATDLKAADAEEFFKSATATSGPIADGPRFGKGQHWYNPRLQIVVDFPGEPQVLPADNIFLFYPKDAPGGAYYTFAMLSGKLDPAVDVEKGYRSLEKAVNENQFGLKPTNVRKKMMGDRPGVAFEIVKGDTPYSCWCVYNNEESAVLLSVRKDLGISSSDEKKFFDSLKFNVTTPPAKDRAPGPGAPKGPGVPGAPGTPPMPGIPIPGAPGGPGPAK